MNSLIFCAVLYSNQKICSCSFSFISFLSLLSGSWVTAVNQRKQGSSDCFLNDQIKYNADFTEDAQKNQILIGWIVVVWFSVPFRTVIFWH